MQYLGGKSRIARRLEAEILARKGGRTRYVEPFIGGGAVFAKVAPHFEDAVGMDVVPDLILLWQAIAEGWLPPEELTREEYDALRHAPPSALRGFAGFGCSFGGKWFGGYAKRDPRINKRGIPYSGTRYAADALTRQAPNMQGRFILGDYTTAPVTADTVVYADPPYAGTTGYGAAGAFDTGRFWRTATAWAEEGAVVLVSELEAPEGWSAVWERAMPTYVRGGGKQRAAERVERLFAYDPAGARLTSEQEDR